MCHQKGGSINELTHPCIFQDSLLLTNSTVSSGRPIQGGFRTVHSSHTIERHQGVGSHILKGFRAIYGSCTAACHQGSRDTKPWRIQDSVQLPYMCCGRASSGSGSIISKVFRAIYGSCIEVCHEGSWVTHPVL